VNNILVINKAVTPGRITAIIVNERLGGPESRRPVNHLDQMRIAHRPGQENADWPSSTHLAVKHSLRAWRARCAAGLLPVA